MEQKKKTSAKSRKSAASGSRTSGKKTGKKENKSKAAPVNQKESLHVPARLVAAVIAAVLCLLFVIMLLVPDGMLVELMYDFMLGIVGKFTFCLSIPALLYFFVIQTFSGKRPVRMRSWCLLAFVLICGCISHFFLPVQSLGKGFPMLRALFEGGIQGLSAGLICGGVSELMRQLLNPVLSVIVLTVAGILTLLGSFQVTVPSIIRAVQNRPRADWEDEVEDKPDPASLVVNHLAAKHIEHEENRRRAKEEKAQIDLSPEGEADIPKKKHKVKPEAEDMMRQIDNDVEAPVTASETGTPSRREESYLVPEQQEDPELSMAEAENSPSKMPRLEKQTEEPADNMTDPESVPEQPAPAKVTAKEAAESAAQVAQEIEENQQIEKPVYTFPPIDLLKRPTIGASDGTDEMKENSRRLNETLESFKIEAHIINVTRGPSVTRYEVELDKGVRLNKLTTVADDIALSLGASGVRIAAVPGKISVVGIEVPNRAVTTVSLREVIDSSEFSNARSKSSFAVGKDIGGSCIIGNIAKLPHMLIAGTTGSGKSVCMNSIIISLLYKASPEDVKLIMIDPKMVELGIYNSIPHLLIPVVTDPKKAAGSLQWAVTEMMRRYKAMSDVGVRDLEAYNSIMEQENGHKTPQVVVIIDELADLMLVAAKEVEESICRIAQMGRAASIHLVIATQRPSADVITGLMKANIPSRIAFAVASAMESRIILDTQGAEKLVGKGDMLFAPIGSGKPVRVQGCFVSDSEVESVANYVKDNFMTTYDEGVMEEIEKKAAQTGSSKGAPAADAEPNEAELGGDEMLPAAVDVILETGQASVSMLQRRLKLGYARAARIVDEMEEKGIVGPYQGSKPRTILVTKEQWAAMKSGQPEQMALEDLAEEVPEDFDA